MSDVIISIVVGRCSGIEAPCGSNADVVHYIDATDSPDDRNSPASGRKITLTTSSKGRSFAFRGIGASFQLLQKLPNSYFEYSPRKNKIPVLKVYLANVVYYGGP